MAADPKARKITIPYPGGSMSGTRGLLEALFGPDLVQVATTTPTNVNRSGHTRRRVIGGDSTGVGGASYQIGQYPSSRHNGGAGGRPIRVNLGGNWWTLRITGSIQRFVAFASGANWATDEAVAIITEKGTALGPFK